MKSFLSVFIVDINSTLGYEYTFSEDSSQQLILQQDDWELYEHKTDPPETLTKKSALDILDFVLLMASKKKIDKLPRAEIKDSLDELVKVIGLPKKHRQ